MSLWLWCLGLILGLSLKNLHFMWHFRFFGALAMGYLSRRRSSCALKQHHVFLPAVVKSRSPATECDFNLHKSNSTYITDLDVSRAYLSGLLFAPIVLNFRDSIHCNLIVSAIACIFHREIKPYQPYEVWTKVASWDDKWIYMVSHFVAVSKHLPGRYVIQGGGSINSKMMEKPATPEDKRHKNVFASAVTRMVFKRGRLTVPPQRALEICGILSTESPTASSHTADKVGTTQSAIECPEWTLEDIEFSRRENLPIVRLERGWDAVRELFRQEPFALTEYNDFMW
ncbi:unnamed protein product [Penicillium manginii]